MKPANDPLFDSDLWETTLEKYAGVTHLTIKLYNADERVVFGPVHPTPLFQLFDKAGYDPGIFAECARRCLSQSGNGKRPAVLVSQFYGLAVVGASLMLDGKIVGAAVGGYTLIDFSQASEVQRLALESGIAFERLWDIARKQRPVSQSRLLIHGELLRVLGDALLRENHRTRQYEEAAARQGLLVNELNHRVKNTLATIQSFAMQTLRNTSNLAEAREALDARLIALSKAHDVLTRKQWQSADLHEVVTKAIAAYSGSGRQANVRFRGPEISLQPQVSLALSMALHELATNAVKYGALSNRTGRVEIKWVTRDEPPEFELRWEEKGGPPVIPPRRRGFGSRLVEQGLSQDLGGDVSLEFGKEGVVCTIRAPLDEVRTGDGSG